jgi:hypothetical protein
MASIAQKVNELASVPFAEQEMGKHIEKVTQSAQFTRSETMKRLLAYLCSHRGKDISEYAIATEALGRRADFDSRTDASVRVQISRLRRKLEAFYELEGATEPFMLYIPMGTHSLIIVNRASEPLNRNAIISLPAPRDALPPSSFLLYIRPILAAICLLLLVPTSWLFWGLYEHGNILQRAAVTPTSFWRSFIGSGTPIKIILPTPVFFTYPNLPRVHIRDVEINDYQVWNKSNDIRSLAEAGGNPTLDYSYTVTSDTLAALDLARYLDSVGISDQVAFEVTDNSSMNILEKNNVVALGAYATLYPFRDYLATMNFSLAGKEAWVDNAHPTSGELPRYGRTTLGPIHSIEPAIIAVLPGRGPNLKLLIMQSSHTRALVSMLTSQVGNSLFEKIYRSHGSPRYFEMVIYTETEGDHIVRTWPVALHAYTRNPPSGADVTQ